MLVIRLQRTGRENMPTYRVVVADKARPVKGKFLEIVGHYLPTRKPVVFEHEDAKIEQWIAKGAIPSDTVARLLRKAGLANMDKFIHRYAKQVSKKNPPPEAPAPAPAAAAAAAPAPAPAPAVEAAPAPAAEPEAAPVQAEGDTPAPQA